MRSWRKHEAAVQARSAITAFLNTRLAPARKAYAQRKPLSNGKLGLERAVAVTQIRGAAAKLVRGDHVPDRRVDPTDVMMAALDDAATTIEHSTGAKRKAILRWLEQELVDQVKDTPRVTH